MPSRRDSAIRTTEANSGLHRYFQQIKKFPVLTAEEELALSRRWRNERDIRAADKLVMAHLRLVARIAKDYQGYGLPVGELVGHGNLGMMQALQRFDPDRGVRLASYATSWIRAAMRDYILQSWSMVKIATTAERKRLFFHLRRAERRLQIVTDDELQACQVSHLARLLYASETTVVSMHQRLSGPDHSLNEPAWPGAQLDLVDTLADENADQEAELAEREEMMLRSAGLKAALQTLGPRQRHILTKRRLSETPSKLDELATEHGISGERVRQIEAQAFAKVLKVMKTRPAAGAADTQAALEKP